MKLIYLISAILITLTSSAVYSLEGYIGEVNSTSNVLSVYVTYLSNLPGSTPSTLGSSIQPGRSQSLNSYNVSKITINIPNQGHYQLQINGGTPIDEVSGTYRALVCDTKDACSRINQFTLISAP